MAEDISGSYQPLNISRILNAPIGVVWEAWTSPEQFSKWWSPDTFTIPVCELDVQIGGKLKVDMQGPDGTIYPTVGEFKEVDEPNSLAYTMTPLDGEGNKLFEVLQSVTFNIEGDKTKIDLRAEVLRASPETKPYLDGMEIGMTQAVQKLVSLYK